MHMRASSSEKSMHSLVLTGWKTSIDISFLFPEIREERIIWR
jgi:hypothetical protein